MLTEGTGETHLSIIPGGTHLFMEGNFMVINLIDHDNLESRTPGSQDDDLKVTLPMVDVVHQLPPVTAPVERKTGGHHDRQT